MSALNLLNRLLAIVLLLALLVVGLVLAIAPSFLGALLRDWATVLDESGGRLQLAGAGLLVALVALALLILELRVRRPAAVALAGESGASLSTDTVIQRLRQDVEAVPDVVRARPLVTARRGRVDVEITVDTTGGVDVPTKASEVRQVATATVERLGLKLGRLNVNLRQTAAAPLLGPPGGSETGG